MGVATIEKVEEKPDDIFRYEKYENGAICVFKNGKLIGRIDSANGIYQFVSRSGEYGDVYASVEEAKTAIEQYKD